MIWSGKDKTWYKPVYQEPHVDSDRGALILWEGEQPHVHEGYMGDLKKIAQRAHQDSPFVQCFILYKGGHWLRSMPYSGNPISWEVVVVAQLPAQVQLVGALAQ